VFPQYQFTGILTACQPRSFGKSLTRKGLARSPLGLTLLPTLLTLLTLLPDVSRET
jgi:hypothetical protein